MRRHWPGPQFSYFELRNMGKDTVIRSAVVRGRGLRGTGFNYVTIASENGTPGSRVCCPCGHGSGLSTGGPLKYGVAGDACRLLEPCCARGIRVLEVTLGIGEERVRKLCITADAPAEGALCNSPGVLCRPEGTSGFLLNVSLTYLGLDHEGEMHEFELRRVVEDDAHHRRASHVSRCSVPAEPAAYSAFARQGLKGAKGDPLPGGPLDLIELRNKRTARKVTLTSVKVYQAAAQVLEAHLAGTGTDGTAEPCPSGQSGGGWWATETDDDPLTYSANDAALEPNGSVAGDNCRFYAPPGTGFDGVTHIVVALRYAKLNGTGEVSRTICIGGAHPANMADCTAASANCMDSACRTADKYLNSVELELIADPSAAAKSRLRIVRTVTTVPAQGNPTTATEDLWVQLD